MSFSCFTLTSLKSLCSEEISANNGASSTTSNTMSLCSETLNGNNKLSFCSAQSTVELPINVTGSATLVSSSNHAKYESTENYNITATPNAKGPIKIISAIEEDVFETIKTIRDPEYISSTLEQLGIVTPESVTVTKPCNLSYSIIQITFRPTVMHCSMASFIGLSICIKLLREYDSQYKIQIFVEDGFHNDVKNINKLCNDKERIAAAMENPDIMTFIEKSIRDFDD